MSIERQIRNDTLEEAAIIADEHSSAQFGHDNKIAVKFWHLGEDYAKQEIAAAIRALKK